MKGFLATNGASNGRLNFQAAFVVNTRLRLRVLKPVEHGLVTGRGGKDTDKSLVGLQVANSMVGDTAVSIQFFIERLLCANGLVAPVSHTENRVFHSGKEENFAKRLDARVHAVLSGAERAIDMLKELGGLLFDPDDLAKANYASEILEIMPDARADLKSVAKGVRFPREMPTAERKWRRESMMIEAVPSKLAVGHSASVFQSGWRDNASMFDFINVFTEKAKELQISQHLESEERAGILANRIAKNKKKFQTLSKSENS